MTTEIKRRVLRPGYNRMRGFATMTPEKKREIASKGGRRAHELGRAHNWRNDPQGAAKAGAIGGKRSKRTRVRGVA